MRVPALPLRKTSGPTPLGEQTSRRKIRYLAQSVALEETGNPLLAKLVTVTVCLIVLAFAVWAALTRIDEIAVTTGSVVPLGQVQVVQHSEGGVVAAILVREGDVVKVGQPLVLLDVTSLKTELKEMRLREMSLHLQVQRFLAFANGQELVSDEVEEAYASLVSDQRKVYQTQVQARDESIKILQSRIRQKQNESELLRKQEVNMNGKLALLREEFALRKNLTERGLSSKVSFLEAQRNLNQTEGDLEQIASKRKLTANVLEESRASLKELTAQLKNRAMTEMSLARSELVQVQESLKRLVRRVEGAEIKAKVSGVVQSLNVHSPGGVIAPRAVVLEIVPLDRELIVESQISSRDIGHIRTNQPVSIKFTAYDFSRYGGVSGTLSQISPTTFLDERGNPYYKAVIVLDSTYVGPEPSLRPVLPGMTVQANIMTGDKTIMEYLLKPIYTSVRQALQER